MSVEITRLRKRCDNLETWVRFLADEAGLKLPEPLHPVGDPANVPFAEPIVVPPAQDPISVAGD